MSLACDTADQISSSADAAEPTVDEPQIIKRGGNLPGSAGISIKQFASHYAFHERL